MIVTRPCGGIYYFTQIFYHCRFTTQEEDNDFVGGDRDNSNMVMMPDEDKDS